MSRSAHEIPFDHGGKTKKKCYPVSSAHNILGRLQRRVPRGSTTAVGIVRRAVMGEGPAGRSRNHNIPRRGHLPPPPLPGPFQQRASSLARLASFTIFARDHAANWKTSDGKAGGAGQQRSTTGRAWRLSEHDIANTERRVGLSAASGRPWWAGRVVRAKRTG